MEAKVLDKEAVTSMPEPSKAVPQAHEKVTDSTYFSGKTEFASTVVGKNPQGGELQITKRELSHGYEVSFRTGGRTPAELTGWFTSYDIAEKASRVYLNRLWDADKADKEYKAKVELEQKSA